jgi:hypothetical protein
MTTPEQSAAVVQQDIQNMEHLGDWDHGMEPDVSNDAEGGPKNQGTICAPFVKKAQAIATKVINSMEKAAHDMGENATQASDENQLNEGGENHAEEEEASMKQK